MPRAKKVTNRTNEKGLSVDPDPKMTQMWGTPGKGYRAAIPKVPQWAITKSLKNK